MFSLFRYVACVISLFRLHYFVISPSLFRYFVMSLSLFRYGAFVILLFRYGAFVMSPRHNEKTKWHNSATINLFQHIQSTKVLNGILCIFAGYFKKGSIADELYPYFDEKSIIKTNNLVCVHFMSSCQYQITRKRLTSKTKWRVNPE